MPENNTYHEDSTGVFWVVALLVFAIFAIGYIIHVWLPFWEERKYIQMEIRRSSAQEVKYWKCKKRKLYIRLIPFFGSISEKKKR